MNETGDVGLDVILRNDPLIMLNFPQSAPASLLLKGEKKKLLNVNFNWY